MRRRVATALVALPLLLAAVLYGPPLLVVGLVALAAFVGLLEYQALVAAKGLPRRPLLGMAVFAAAFVDALRLLDVSLLPVIVTVALAFVLLGVADDLPGLALAFLGGCYLGGLGGTLAALRVLPAETHGASRLLLLLVSVMAADSAALFVGMAFGRRKLAPAISPKKTVEGAIGGLAGGALGAWALARHAFPGLPGVEAAALGVGAAVLGTAGDLVESRFKRWAGVKDSGTLFPGHGGMLDRLDSLLFAAPLLYYYFLVR